MISLIDKWKTSAAKDKSFGAFLTDLSKAFSCHPYALLTAMLHAHGFSLNFKK